ncbi:MAG: toxin-activating lysine-acyltransferase [Parvibaculaceae bacterium]|nr:toxin-activating lysine-acyltransferase [Parvibaculaceae bacterium]
MTIDCEVPEAKIVGSEDGAEASAPLVDQGEPKEARPETGLTSLVGSIFLLMMSSPTHKNLLLSDMEWLVMPAVSSKQMRLIRHKDRPAAYVSWAFLSDEAEQRLLSHSPRLTPRDWNSGEKVWIVDLVAPETMIDSIVSQLRTGPLAAQEFHIRLAKPDGSFVTQTYTGADYNPKAA